MPTICYWRVICGSMRVLIVEDGRSTHRGGSTWRDERAARCRGVAQSPGRSRRDAQGGRRRCRRIRRPSCRVVRVDRMRRSRRASDIDLAVIAPNRWDRRVEMADAVRTRLGNDCDVLVFTPAEFEERARGGEPVVGDILRDGVALVGTKPRVEGERRDGDHRAAQSRAGVSEVVRGVSRLRRGQPRRRALHTGSRRCDPRRHQRQERCIQHACSRMLPAGSISSAYRNPDTCWQHHAALSGGMSYSEPGSVNLYLVSLLPLAVISIGWLSLRIAGPRAARA